MPVVNIISNLIRGYIRQLAHFLNRLSKGRLTPSMVTTVGFAMHLPIAWLIAVDHLLWAAGLLFVFGLFDVLDGELARLQKSASSQGMLYDAATDRLKETLLYAGIAYYLVNTGDPQWAFIAVLACGISISVSYAKAKGEAALALKGKIKDHHTLNRHFKEGLVPFEIRMTIIWLGLLSGQVLIATAVIAVLATITMLDRLKIIGRQL